MTLCYAKGTAALAPHILLQEAGAAYDLRLVDFARADQRGADYLALNPKGRVPALITPRGVLSETPAILAYIAQTHPAADLAPTDAFDFARAQAFNAYLCATLHVAHAHKMRGARWADDAATHLAMRAKVRENMEACARMIERHFLAGPWVLGEAYSMCDPYLFVAGRWLVADGAEIEDFPAIRDHGLAMRERAAVREVLPLHDL